MAKCCIVLGEAIYLYYLITENTKFLLNTKYYLWISRAQNKPSSDIYFENLFHDYNIDWTIIYALPCLITNSTYMRSFQYKILNNVLFLNKKLHSFGIKPSTLCSFCNLYDETPYHMFYECDRVKCLWSDLVQCF